MSDISSQLIKDSYNYVLQSDLSTGNIYRVGGGIPVNPSFLSGLTINSSFKFSNGSEQPGYALITDGFGNATWGPVSGSSSGNYLSLSGGTVTGPTIFTGGLTANTISATTYFNLPSGLTCNGLSGCTIIQNIEQDIIDIQDNYVPYTGATRDLDLGYNTFINNNGLFTTWNNEFSEGEAKVGYDYQGAKQMYFRDVDKTNNFQYSAQTTEMLCNIEVGWNVSNNGVSFDDGTVYGSTINNTIGAAGFNTQMGDNNVSQVKTFAGEVALTNLNDGAGPLMESSIRLWKDYTQLLITNNDTTESNTIEMYTDRTYTKKYIEAPGFEGDYANLNTLTSTTISATTYLNLPVTSLSGLSDVSITSVSGGEVLVYSGSSWVNKPLSAITGEYNYRLPSPVSFSGTAAETEVLRLELPPYTFASNDMLRIPALIVQKTGTVNSYTIRVKLSTSPTMPPTTTDMIATYTASASTLTVNMTRTWFLSGGILRGLGTSNIISDYNVSAVQLNAAFDHTITNYLYISIDSAGGQDTQSLVGFQLTNR